MFTKQIHNMLLLIIFIWIICPIAGYQLGKDRTVGAGGGLALGLFLGLIGVVIVACFPRNYDVNIDDINPDVEIMKSYARINEEKQNIAALPDELLKWFDLKEKGVITQEEFEVKKKTLMRNG